MRVLVIEDSFEVQETMRHFLSKSGFAVDCADNGEDGIELATVTEYDVILLDLNLPDIDGFEVCEQLRDAGIDTPIIMVTARSEVADRTYGLNVGADDYLVKPFSMEELVARIRAILRRVRNRAEANIVLGDMEILPDLVQVVVAGVDFPLTPKEYEILYYLALESPKVCSLEAIIEHVWDDSGNPFSNAARVHVMNLRNKLNAASASVQLKTVKGKGYALCIV
ncbi:response regulator transcription factor [Culicoidibacter larvae]|nr:response regulator transcription factor [Culicoidibacter larvae]